ncbi:MAG: CHRD domain-containing protein [Proteobacteria bacterium]|nr:CHRD domain-containing protein [Pseudomonadota bacterium]
MKINRRILTVALPLLTLFAVASCGGGGGSSPPPPPPPDTTAPTVSTVQAPAGTANRIVTLTVTASDNVGVTDVRFFVDGVLLGNDTTAPYSIDWDTSGEAEGDHNLSAEAQDAAGNIGQSAVTVATVRNLLQFIVALSGQQQVPAADSQATAQADLTINLATGATSGELNITGLVAIAAHIHDAFAGVSGGVLIGLDVDPMDASRFIVPAAAMLNAAGVDRLLAGALYVNVHTAALPDGEIRGQILPVGFVLRFTDLAGSQSVPAVDTFARGRAAITLDLANGTLVVHAQAEELDTANQSHVHDAYAGSSGPVLVALSPDPMDAGHWFVEDGLLNAAGMSAFAAGRLYVNIHSPTYPGGEIRGQILPEGITLLVSQLSGEQEVPAVDTKASGLAALTLDEAGLLLTLHVNNNRLNNATGAHLHGEYAGAIGGIEIVLIQDGAEPGHWFAEEQALNAGQLTSLLAGATYVNVHTMANPGGEVRGQVIPEGILLALGRLDGGQAVPPIASLAGGGTFAVTIDPAASTLVAHANTNGVDDAFAAHLHEAFAGTSGGVVIPLAQDPLDVKRWSVINAALSAAQLATVSAGGFYVNVHTPANPGGEIRGQVAPPPIEVVLTQMSGDQEVPAVASAASGIAASTVNRETGDITLHLNVSGAVNMTASHIHLGYAGQTGGVAIALALDGADPDHWSVVTQLNAAELADYMAGRHYVNLHTMVNMGGEIRGQIAPRDIQIVFSPMDGAQVVPAVVTAAAGVASTTTDLKSRRFVAFINETGVDTATSAGIHLAKPGENGAEVLALQQTPMLPGQWSGVSQRLDPDSFLNYRAGRLYAQVATLARMNGEIRGQIDPPGAADFDIEAPTVTLMSPGANVTGTVTLDADANDDMAVVEVRFLANGVLIDTDTTAPYSIDWDTTSVANGQVTLTAEADDAAGNVGVSNNVIVTIQNATAVTLTQLQNQIFTPICSGCHSGFGVGLPGVMNLTAGNSHASLVGVPSIEVPALFRVEPTNPDDSYLIRKLEGGPGIVGVQMPQFGPFLDQATIDQVRQWITDGAANN